MTQGRPDNDEGLAHVTGASAAPEVSDAEGLPVVARLVVEIRSDGSRTIARGGVEDHLSGERVSVEARADSPLELATALTRMLLSSPRMARRALQAAPDARRGLRSSLRRLLRRRPPEED